MIQQPRTYEQLQESVKKYRECNIKLNFQNQKLHNKVASLENQMETLQASQDKSKLLLADVSKQREQLIAFQSWQFDKGYLYQKNLQNGMIEEFLKSNL